MSSDPLTQIRTRNTETPQSEQASPAQVPNNAGGYSFEVTAHQRALRFLILGSDGGTFYVSERDLSKDNAAVIIDMAADPERGIELVNLIVAVSTAGRAPRQNPTIFALAVCASSPAAEVRAAALAVLHTVCRTGTMLFMFAHYVEQFRGWGRGLREAVAKWYLDPPVADVAYQAVKYRSRRVEGAKAWSHRDLLRLSHPRVPRPGGVYVRGDDAAIDAAVSRHRTARDDSAARRALFEWICRGAATPGPGADEPDSLRDARLAGLIQSSPIPIVEGYLRAQAATTPAVWARLVADYRLSWEMLPDAAMREPAVWRALLPHMGLTALVRNLGRLTNLGVIKALDTGYSAFVPGIVTMLTDAEQVVRARLHPLKVLDALETYRSGHGLRGSLTWTPVPQVIDALERCFYLSFGAVTPANKRTLIALDVSGSMAMGTIAGSSVTPRVASAVLAMVTARSEPAYLVTAFAHLMVPVTITAAMSLSEAVRAVDHLPFGGTDCSLPMLYAGAHNLEVDTFQILTDNETWGSRIHPHEALRQYRQRSGIPSRLVVVGMTATQFSIAAVGDPGMLDVVGMDTATPELIASFSRGDF